MQHIPHAYGGALMVWPGMPFPNLDGRIHQSPFFFIATSNRSMDWHKYPKSRMSTRIGQPETLDSTKYHTFPGFRGKTLDILWHNLTLQFFFVPNVLIEMLNRFIVIPAQRLHALASQSDLLTSKST